MTYYQKKLKTRLDELGLGDPVYENFGQTVSIEVYSENHTLDGGDSIYYCMNNVPKWKETLAKTMLSDFHPLEGVTVRERQD